MKNYPLASTLLPYRHRPQDASHNITITPLDPVFREHDDYPFMAVLAVHSKDEGHD